MKKYKICNIKNFKYIIIKYNKCKRNKYYEKCKTQCEESIL